MLKKDIKNRLEEIKRNNIQLQRIIDYLDCAKIEYGIVGGFIKDCILKKNTSRDIDIIVDAEPEFLKRMIKDLSFFYSMNSCKGYKINNIDIWCLSEHLPFKAGLFKPKWKNIPYSSWLSIMGAVYLPRKNNLILGKLKRTLKKKHIKMYCPKKFFNSEVPNKKLLIIKLNDYILEGYSIDSNLQKFMKEDIKEES